MSNYGLVWTEPSVDVFTDASKNDFYQRQGAYIHLILVFEFFLILKIRFIIFYYFYFYFSIDQKITSTWSSPDTLPLARTLLNIFCCLLFCQGHLPEAERNNIRVVFIVTIMLVRINDISILNFQSIVSLCHMVIASCYGVGKK